MTEAQFKALEQHLTRISIQLDYIFKATAATATMTSTAMAVSNVNSEHREMGEMTLPSITKMMSNYLEQVG